MTVEVFIDGSEVPALEGSTTRRLNRPSTASAKVPADASVGGAGSLMKVVVDGNLHHHGRVMDCETEMGEDSGYTTYNSADPMEMWRWRPARDPDGDFSKPTFLEDFVTGPQIMESILATSDDGSDPTVGEGTLFLEFGSFEGGGVDLSGAPTDWPMTIAEIAALLCDTGELDIVLTPIDSGGNLAQIDCYNGDYGSDLSGSVIFQYGLGSRNVRALRWNQDMSDSMNKLWYYLGPRVETPEDPAGDQHWRANITADDTDLIAMDPPYSDVIARRVASQGSIGVRMDIRIYDARGDEAAVGRDLYRRLWLIEQYLRAVPRELIHVSPTRETNIGTFDIGDLVGVQASSAVRGGFTGAQRVYQYTIAWDSETKWLDELQTSPSQEGF